MHVDFRLASRKAATLFKQVDKRVDGSAAVAKANRYSLFNVTVVAGTFTVAVVRLVGLVQACAVNLMYQDQWDLMRPLFAGDGPWACFRWQHGPHRQGLGGVINWYLYRATDWDVRAEAWAAVAILVLAAIAAVVLAVRVRGSLRWTDAVYPLLLVSPLHWETMLLTPNLAHGILPVLLVFLLAHAWISSYGATRVAGVGLINLFCLFTGFGFCAFVASVMLIVLLWMRSDAEVRGGLAWIGILAVVAAIGFSWQYRWEPAVPGWRFPVANWWDYPRFLALMFSSLAGWRAVSGPTVVAGSALLLSVGVACAWSARELWCRPARREVQAVWLLTGTSLVYGAFTAIGRLPVNLEAAFMWRYLTLMIPAIAGLTIFAEHGFGRAQGDRLRGTLAVGSVALVLLIWGNFTPDRYAAVIARAKNQWIESYRTTHDLAVTNQQADFTVYVRYPESAMIAERLRWLEARHLSFFSQGRDAPEQPRK